MVHVSENRNPAPLIAVALFVFVCFSLVAPEAETPPRIAGADESPSRVDPAAWGTDHVGQPVPEYVTGDECLFCHRKDVGPTWSSNRHQLSMRSADPESVEMKALSESPAAKDNIGAVEFLLGHTHLVRFLKRGREYGTLSLLSVECQPAAGENPPLTPGPSPARGEGKKGLTPPPNGTQILNHKNPHWDDETFGRRCAGCHATGIDSKTHAFAAVSLDCYVCHGEGTLDHSKEPSKMILAKGRHDEPRVVVSICAQCHVRTGKSRSTGLPYANNFVAGDNLFRDLQVDFSDASLASLNPADRHVLENVRDVVVHDRREVTCLSCHDVHKQSSRKHHRVASGTICLHCHNAEGPKSQRPQYEVHSPLCEY